MKNSLPSLPGYFDHSSEYLYSYIDKDFRLIKANSLFRQKFELLSDDYIGRPFHEVISLIEYKKLVQAGKTCLQEPGTIIKIELNVKTASGDENWFQWDVSSVLSETGNEPGIQIIGIDITDKKKSEQQLLYQAILLDNISDAVISTDQDFIIKSLNKAAEKIYGIKAADAVGKPVMDLFKYNFINNTFNNALDELLQKGCWKGEVSFKRTADQNTIYLYSSVTSMKDNYGTVAGYVAVNHLIKQTPADTEHPVTGILPGYLENYYRRMIDEVLDYAIFSLNKNGFILDWNKGAEKIKGYKEEDIVGKHFSIFYTKEDQQNNLAEELLESAVKYGRVTYEGWRVKKNKDLFWGNMVLTALHNHKGEVTGFSKVTRDLTEKKIAEAQLNVSEKNFRQVLSSISEGFFMLDKNCRIVVINKMGKKMIEWISGRPVETGQSVLDFLPKEKQEALQSYVDKTFTGSKSEYESYYSSMGKNFWFNLTYTPVKDENRNIIGTCLVARDITERKKAERALDKSQKMFSAFMANTPAMAWIIDEQHKFRYLNKSYKQAFGLDESAIGKSIYTIFPKEICDPFIENNRRVWNRGAAIETIEDGIGPKGEKQVYQIYKFPLGEDNGIKLLGGVALDITRNVLTQKNLQRSNERYDYATKATSDAIWDWDIEKDVLYSGDGFKNIFGYTIPPKTMKQRTEGIHPEDRDRISKSLKKALQSNDERWKAEYRFISHDNTFKIILDKGYIIRNEKKEAVRMIGAMQDVTEQRNLEEKLTIEEKKKKREIIQAIIDAQEKERRELAYELHDNVNQILSSSKLMLEVVAESKETNMEFVSKTNEYLRQAINELRRISHNLSPGILKDISLEAAILDIVEQVNNSGKLHIIYRKRNYTKGKNPADGDIQLTILRIAQEQLNNILKHADASEIILQLFITKTRIILSIKDNGKGFDILNTKKGLGLHNIFNRTEYYQGMALLESTPGNGCLLKIEIPVPE
ncbi:MAG: PAS domain S-box protein [Bacteroidota bacterium]